MLDSPISSPPPSPSLIVLDVTQPRITLLDAQDDLDLFSLDQELGRPQAQQTNETSRVKARPGLARPTTSSSSSNVVPGPLEHRAARTARPTVRDPLSKVGRRYTRHSGAELETHDEGKYGDSSLITLRDGSVLVLRPALAKVSNQPDRATGSNPNSHTQVAPLVDLEVAQGDTILFGAQIPGEGPKSRYSKKGSRHSPTATSVPSRISTPSPVRSPVPVPLVSRNLNFPSKASRHSSRPTQPKACLDRCQDPFIVSPKPLRPSKPFVFNPSLPEFRPKASPTPAVEHIGLISITDPSKVGGLFKADIKWYDFPPIPKIFWGKSKLQARYEERKALEAESEEEIDSEIEGYGGERERYEVRNGANSTTEAVLAQNGHRGTDNDGVSGQTFRRNNFNSKVHAGPYEREEPVLLNLDRSPLYEKEQDTYETEQPYPLYDDPLDAGPVDRLLSEPPSAYLDFESYNFAEPSYLVDIQDSTIGDRVRIMAQSDTPRPELMPRPNVSAAKFISKSAYRKLLSLPSPRTHIPRHILSPTNPDPLNTSILQAWAKTEPSQTTKTRVKSLLVNLTRIINAQYGSSTNSKAHRFEVDVFGSVAWGGETGLSGDLDLVVIDHDMPFGYEPAVWRRPPADPSTSTRNRKTPRPPLVDVPSLYNVNNLARVLFTQGGFRDAFSIPGATTPIVKFSETNWNPKLECDIQVNDLGGWYNSSLILHYCLISPHVLRPMIYALKRWAAAYSLNDASGAKGPATMSSYCLTLMAIAYLQYRGVLPNLQASVTPTVPDDPAAMDDDVVWVSWGRDQGIKAHIGFALESPKGWTSRELGMSAADAVRGFFSFFSRKHGDSMVLDHHTTGPGAAVPSEKMAYEQNIISVVQGGIVPRTMSHGLAARQRETRVQQLKTEGVSMSDIGDILVKEKQEGIEAEVNMGKGDRGIQPGYWNDSLIVVQDPFLYAKNCAAMMSKEGRLRFMATLDETHQLLSTDPNVTLDDLIKGAKPPLNTVPRAGRGRPPSRGTPSVIRTGMGFGRGGGGRGGGRGRGFSPSPSINGSVGRGGIRGRGRGASPVSFRGALGGQ